MGDVLNELILCVLRVKLGQEVQQDGLFFRDVMVQDLSKHSMFILKNLFSVPVRVNKNPVVMCK